jgi:hypothetical protein
VRNLSPGCVAFSGCGWKKWLPKLETGEECDEQGAMDNQGEITLKFLGWTMVCETMKLKYINMLPN